MLAERDRRRQLLLLDPSADVFAGGPPPSLRSAGGASSPGGVGSAGASEEYDIISALLGEGQRTEAGNFFLGPYLQSG